MTPRHALHLLLAGLFLVLAGTAEAQRCTASMSNVSFGTVTLRAGAANSTSGSLQIDCTGLVQNIGVCVEFGSGDGGAAAGLSPRYMKSGNGSALPFELRRGGNGTAGNIWRQEFVTVFALLGGRATMPVFADIVATGPGAGTSTGPHVSTFSGATGARIRYGVSSCAETGTVAPIPPFQVSAFVSDSCEVDAATLDFGRIGPDARGGVDAATGITVRCTRDTNYTVRLGLGTGSGATGPADRRMTGPLGAQLRYGLYMDAGRSQPWGDTPGTLPPRVLGTGSSQTFTVFGRIFGDQPLRAGAYTDSVLVTVEY
ncbi:spore coat U domain-containing protein [Palleronia sp. LCG004]|uniref:Csu type fimbrial protein n=1 Tax=Palleronia sp. LCG004 TaxID=3079304 RepID=UPI002941CF06|nr:spore coat U domain-containing protein [Palleronia sp. LCG004]WOI58434.1 spore coat U domain-containing protein [Palleronia sp. LCG004]